MHTGLTGTAETTRLSQRNGFTTYFVLSPVSGLYCHRCRTRTGRADRRQDHTTSPSAARPFAVESAASIASRAQRVVTMAIRPSWRVQDDLEHTSVLRKCQAEIRIDRNGVHAGEISLISLGKFASACRAG